MTHILLWEMELLNDKLMDFNCLQLFDTYFLLLYCNLSQILNVLSPTVYC